jgi:hypothetical protein
MDRKKHEIGGGYYEPTSSAAATAKATTAGKRRTEIHESGRSRGADGNQRILRLQDYEEAQQRAGAARENHNSRADFAKVPVRKNLLLTCYAFRKTAALLFTIAAITIAGQALNDQAIGIDTQQHQEPSQSTAPATVASHTAYIARETASRSMTSNRPVPKAETWTSAEPEPASTVRIYDIPLSEEMQAFTFNLCEEYGVDYEMVLAIMDKESDYTASAKAKPTTTASCRLTRSTTNG